MPDKNTSSNWDVHGPDSLPPWEREWLLEMCRFPEQENIGKTRDPEERRMDAADMESEIETDNPDEDGGLVPPGYHSLFFTLQEALDRAAKGKGGERHADGKAWEDQPIREITRRLTHHPAGSMLFQAVKKIYETDGYFAKDGVSIDPLRRAKAEILDVIVYSAAAVQLLDELILREMPDPF